LIGIMPEKRWELELGKGALHGRREL
jgi:hypothetical protein